ncbi:MAG: phage major capsid protein [Alphaproteobacteria bacterium]|nr:phage major capsid protein [Alphaproteobacteria bacterium]
MSDNVKDMMSEIGSHFKNTTLEVTKSMADLQKNQSRTDEKLQYLMETVKNGTSGEVRERSETVLKYRKAFMDYIRKGRSGEIELAAIQNDYRSEWADRLAAKGNHYEAKALSHTDSEGGYTVPEDMASSIVRRLQDFSPVRRAATVSTTSKDALQMLVRDADIGIAGLAEGAAVSETTAPTFGKNDIPVHKKGVYIFASEEILEDSGFDLEAEIAREAADKFARAEGANFVSGTGTGQAKGFLTYTAGTSFGEIEQVNSGAAAALTKQGLVDVLFSLGRETYLRNASWMMNASTWGNIVNLESTGGEPLPESWVNLSKMELLGRPVIVADDMPIVAANALSVAVGDFAEGYRIVDHISGIRMTRDEITAPGTAKFYFRKRTGGEVVNSDAIKIQKISA